MSRPTSKRHVISQRTKPFEKRKRLARDAGVPDRRETKHRDQMGFWIFILVLYLGSYLFFTNFVF